MSSAEPTILERATAERRQARRENWRLLRRRPGFVIGSIISLFWIVCAIGGDAVAPKDAFTGDPFATHAAPNATYWFGTDRLGREQQTKLYKQQLGLPTE